MEVSSALCFAWAGYLVHRDVLPPVHNIVARNEHCVQRTLPVRTVFFVYIIIRWTRGGGGYNKVLIGTDSNDGRQQVNALRAFMACAAQQRILWRNFWIRPWSHVKIGTFGV